MLEIKNTEVFGLERAIRASGNAMTISDINTKEIIAGNDRETLDSYVSDKDYERGKRLGKTPVGSAHDHFLVGIHVQFDIKYPQYWTIEAERYHNFEIISSQSKMHRLMIMGKEENFSRMFNKYVSPNTVNIIQGYMLLYNFLDSMELNEDGITYSFPLSTTLSIYKYSLKELQNEKYECFMRVLSNLPMGFEMWMTCDLTYLQLKTMYFQRKNHKLKEDWGVFCDWCESLPFFKELTGFA